MRSSTSKVNNLDRESVIRYKEVVSDTDIAVELR